MLVKNVEKKDSKTASFQVEVDANEFDKAVTEAFNKNKSSISIPGFRKGKAPRAVVEGMYGSDVFYQDAIDALLAPAYEHGYDNCGLRIIGKPAVSNMDLSDDKILTFTFDVELYPEVTLGEYKNLSAAKETFIITEEDVDGQINGVRKRNGRVIDLEREAQMGDTADIDFVGTLDGAAFDGGSAEGYELELGSNTFVPGFEEQIVGMNIGDVKDIIQRDFASADGNGYIVLPPQVLNAGNYGVPESRERVIFIGIRKDVLRKQALAALTSQSIPEEYNPYPRPTHAGNTAQPGLLPKVTTYDVLKYLPEPADAVDPSQRIYSKAKFQTNGSQGQTEIKLDGLGPTIRSEHHGNIEYRRLSAEHGGKHIAELDNGMQERRLTPRECALIQTFPPDFRFVMHDKDGRKYRLSSSGAYKVIGNAVPPVLAFNIAMRLQNLWDKYFID